MPSLAGNSVFDKGFEVKRNHLFFMLSLKSAWSFCLSLEPTSPLLVILGDDEDEMLQGTTSSVASCSRAGVHPSSKTTPSQLCPSSHFSSLVLRLISDASLNICNEKQKASLTLLSWGMESTRSLKCSLLKGKPSVLVQFLPVSFREHSASQGLSQRGGIPCSESLTRRHSGGVRNWTLHTQMQLCFKVIFISNLLWGRRVK